MIIKHEELATNMAIKTGVDPFILSMIISSLTQIVLACIEQEGEPEPEGKDVVDWLEANDAVVLRRPFTRMRRRFQMRRQIRMECRRLGVSPKRKCKSVEEEIVTKSDTITVLEMEKIIREIRGTEEVQEVGLDKPTPGV